MLVALCAVMLAACAPISESSEVWVAPDFELTSLDGETIRLSDRRGQWVILTFWATWCAPCTEELPALQTLYAAGGVEVIAVNMREDAATVRLFVDGLGITYPVGLNPDDSVVLDYAVMGLPQTFVIDPQGVVVWRGFGPGLPPALWA